LPNGLKKKRRFTDIALQLGFGTYRLEWSRKQRWGWNWMGHISFWSILLMMLIYRVKTYKVYMKIEKLH
jgi:hypothetical protein